MQKNNTFFQFNLATACPGLQLGEDGIYYSKQVEEKVESGKRNVESEAISYPEEGNEACFEIEDQSFWFRHRNNCIRELVMNFPPRGHFGCHIRERVSDLKCIKMFAML